MAAKIIEILNFNSSQWILSSDYAQITCGNRCSKKPKEVTTLKSLCSEVLFWSTGLLLFNSANLNATYF